MTSKTNKTRTNGVPRLRRAFSQEFEGLTTDLGVYALGDLDKVPIYVGQTVSIPERGVKGRVRRHLTSARSDVIANRQLDVWELAFVWSWPISKNSGEDNSAFRSRVDEFERQVYYHFRDTIVAGKLLAEPQSKKPIAQGSEICILEPDELNKRRDPRLRLARAIRLVDQLLDVILIVKDTNDQRRSLEKHIDRLGKRYREFVGAAPPEAGSATEE
jgi:hypothetical protein